MDERLKYIAENYEQMKIGPDDPFHFCCKECGKCCIHREDILLSPHDLFRAARELGMTTVEFYNQYCEGYIGQDSRLSIIRLMPQGSVRRCPLLKNHHCMIHKVKPAVCAMFPVGRGVAIPSLAGAAAAGLRSLCHGSTGRCMRPDHRKELAKKAGFHPEGSGWDSRHISNQNPFWIR